MSLLLALMLLLGAEPQPPVLPTMPSTLNDSRQVDTVLKIYGQADLRNAHMGYWAALQANPEWLQHESVWWQLSRTSDLGPLLARLDELLQRNPESQRLYDAFYGALAANPELNRNLAAFERAALKAQQDPRAWLNAISFLRSDPAKALQYLAGIQADSALPDALKPYATKLMDARSWASMREPLSKLAEDAGTAQALAPWWKQAAELDASQGGLFSKLGLYFLQHPNRFEALHQREVALAADPHLRDWVRWFHRRLRRERVQYTDYLAYLGNIQSGQETPPIAPSKPWPPDGPPPELGVIAEDRLPALRGEAVREPVKPQVAEPKRPQAPKPEKPARVEMRQSERLKRREAATPQ